MDQNYWKLAYEIRNYILDSMRQSRLDFLEKEDLLPCPDNQRVAQNGGLCLRILNGVPESLLTPLGEINFIRRRWLPAEEQHDEDLMHKLQKEFGLVEVLGPTTQYWGTVSIYAITKSPIENYPDTLPMSELIESELSLHERSIIWEKAHAVDIYVARLFRK